MIKAEVYHGSHKINHKFIDENYKEQNRYPSIHHLPNQSQILRNKNKQTKTQKSQPSIFHRFLG